MPLKNSGAAVSPPRKDRITHRIEITSAAEIDGEMKKWLKTAYDLDA